MTKRDTPPVAPTTRQERYAERRTIGTGGSGEVRLVHDRVLDREVALKVLAGRLKDEARPVGAFLGEARLNGRLDHPGIVPVHDLGLDPDGRPWFTMKAVEGRTFGAWIRENGPAPPRGALLRDVLEVVLKVCDAVSFAHAHGVLHCDLKPSNLMVGGYGQVYLMDWGIARALEARDEESSIAGTPGFMSPEQANGGALDERTDVHGIGAVLYFALTGFPPYMGDGPAGRMMAARRGDLSPPEAWLGGAELPPGLRAIVMKALSPSAADRHATVRELADELRRFLHGGWWFERRAIPAGTVIMREGDEADVAYIVTAGTAEACSGDRVLAAIGPGTVFGELAILAGGVRTATVVARTDLEVLVVSKESLESEIGRDTWLSLFVHTLVDRFREVAGRGSTGS